MHAVATILAPEEIHALTGYRRPAEQLAELLCQGFYRARRSPVDGSVILERPHFEHICAGGGIAANDAEVRPRVRSAR